MSSAYGYALPPRALTPEALVVDGVPSVDLAVDLSALPRAPALAAVVEKLKRRSALLPTRWNRRLFRVDAPAHMLLYYHSLRGEGRPAGGISLTALERASVVAVRCMQLVAANRDFILRFSDEAQCAQWAAALSEYIASRDAHAAAAAAAAAGAGAGLQATPRRRGTRRRGARHAGGGDDDGGGGGGGGGAVRSPRSRSAADAASLGAWEGKLADTPVTGEGARRALSVQSAESSLMGCSAGGEFTPVRPFSPVGGVGVGSPGGPGGAGRPLHGRLSAPAAVGARASPRAAEDPAPHDGVGAAREGGGGDRATARPPLEVLDVLDETPIDETPAFSSAEH